MPSLKIRETRDSRESTIQPPSERRMYAATGTTDENYVRTYALGYSPAFIAHPKGTLYRQDLKIRPDGYATWRVEVPYGPQPQDDLRVRFSTTGGTLHITNSRETVQKYTRPAAKAAPDMGGAIGVRGDQIDGTDVVIPALNVQVSVTHPQGIITTAQMKNLARWTGRYNTTAFMTFAAGEVLFLGADGELGTSVETSVTYSFAMSENTTGQTIGDIANVDKKGWEHAWIYCEDAEVNGVATKRPRWVYVERVYQGIDLAASLGFGA